MSASAPTTRSLPKLQGGCSSATAATAAGLLRSTRSQPSNAFNVDERVAAQPRPFFAPHAAEEKGWTCQSPALFFLRYATRAYDFDSLFCKLRFNTLSTTFSTSVRKKLLAGCCTATWVPWPNAAAISFQR